MQPLTISIGHCKPIGPNQKSKEKSTSAIRVELIESMKDWMMVELDEDSSLIKIKPLLGVLAGTFPADFEGGEN